MTFSEELYDEVPPGEVASEESNWSFDETDRGAPHYPWGVRWYRGFAALKNLHERLDQVGPQEIQAEFGPFIDGVQLLTAVSKGKGL